ncbi:MAG: hypothetical protein K2H58_05650, partial [Paramuribaculum sp.]|nr:hypothetical protein [Paramuribaculum sp.]
TNEMMTDETLYDGNTLVKITQGGNICEFVTAGCPFTMSSFQPTYGPAPSLVGNNEEILTALGYTAEQQAQFAANGTTEPVAQPAAAKPAAAK